MIQLEPLSYDYFLITAGNGKRARVSTLFSIGHFMWATLDLCLSYEEIGVLLDVMNSSNSFERAMALGYSWLRVKPPYKKPEEARVVPLGSAAMPTVILRTGDRVCLTHNRAPGDVAVVQSIHANGTAYVQPPLGCFANWPCTDLMIAP